LQSDLQGFLQNNGRRASFLQAGSQVGPQAGSQAFGASQAGSQALTGQQAFTGSQVVQGSQPHGAQPQSWHFSKSLMPANKSRTGVGRQHFVLPQVGSQTGSQAGSQALTGQQAGSQAFTGQQALTGSQVLQGSQGATLAQALQPPFSVTPSNRVRISPPKLWLYRATLSKSAPKIVLLFIEQQLLYSELVKRGFGTDDRKHPIAQGAGSPMGKNRLHTDFPIAFPKGGSACSVRTVYCARSVEPFLGSNSYPIRLPDAPSSHVNSDVREFFRVTNRIGMPENPP
jgi:hypothetical protein